jgi:ketosteroid isomerase-like protein
MRRRRARRRARPEPEPLLVCAKANTRRAEARRGLSSPNPRSDTEGVSRENVELVRRAYRAWNERDFDAWVACATPDVEWRLIGGFADLMGTVFKGHEGLRRFFEEWLGSLEGQVEAESILEADDGVVVIMRVLAAGSASGAPVAIRAGQVVSFRDGLISSVDSYYEPSEALAAVGLSEQDVHAESS